MVGRNMSQKSPVTSPGIDPGTARLVAQRLNHYATPGPPPPSPIIIIIMGTSYFKFISVENLLSVQKSLLISCYHIPPSNFPRSPRITIKIINSVTNLFCCSKYWLDLKTLHVSEVLCTECYIDRHVT
jgi:hypothetical protein